MRRRKDVLNYGTLLNFRYKTSELIGRGSFGQVYSAFDTTTLQEMAVKIEAGKKNCQQVIEVEMNVMKALQKSPYVVRLVDSGKINGLMYLVMERLGPDLSFLRKGQRGAFSLYTTLHLGIQMINILESIHKMGLIHRDIKPSNFCLGRREGTTGQVFLIDFSLARRFKFHNGKIKSPRRKVGFRGTSRFASVNSHRGLDLYPRDDLWSVWYSIVEMFLGKLPWEGMKDRRQVGLLKTRFHHCESYKNVPYEFDIIRKYLYSLSYKKVPDYEYIRTVLVSLFHKRGFSADLPMDWERTFTGESTVTGSTLENISEERKDSSEMISFGSTAVSYGVESVKSFSSRTSSPPKTLNRSFSSLLESGEKRRSKSSVAMTRKPRVPGGPRKVFGRHTKSIDFGDSSKPISLESSSTYSENQNRMRNKSFSRQLKKAKKTQKKSGGRNKNFFRSTKSSETSSTPMFDPLEEGEPFEDDPFADVPRVNRKEEIPRSSSVPGVTLRRKKKKKKKKKDKSPLSSPKKKKISLSLRLKKKKNKVLPLQTSENTTSLDGSEELEEEENVDIFLERKTYRHPNDSDDNDDEGRESVESENKEEEQQSDEFEESLKNESSDGSFNRVESKESVDEKNKPKGRRKRAKEEMIKKNKKATKKNKKKLKFCVIL